MKRIIELTKRYILYFLNRFLFAKEGDHFINLFKVYNKFLYHWPLEVEYDADSDLYLITDDTGKEIFITNPNKLGRYRNGIEDRLLSLGNEYMLDRCELNDGDIVIDVGANIGEFSMLVRDISKAKFICLEPEEREFNCLRENLKDTNAQILQKALWFEEGEMTLYQKNRTNDSSLIEPLNYESQIKIEVDTLDNIVLRDLFGGIKYPKIKLLKLEAEGAEPEILMGAIKCLQFITYVTADIGPERGLKSENTLVQVNSILNKHKFELIGYQHGRGVALYKNSLAK